MALPDVGHAIAFSRDGNDTAVWYWNEGDSTIGQLWSIGSATAYRGTGCSLDRMRGLAWYGMSAGTAGTNSLGIFELSDGSTVDTTTSSTYDNYHCTFIHPVGIAFYTEGGNSSPSTNFYLLREDGGIDAVLTGSSNVGRTLIYVTHISPDIYDRPDTFVLTFGVNSSTYWNSNNSNPGLIYVRQYNFRQAIQGGVDGAGDGFNTTLFTFNVNTYTSDTCRIRFMKGWCTPTGDIIIAIGTATSTDGGFIARFHRDGTNVWAVGKRTDNSDVRNSQFAGIDMLAGGRYLYWGSGSTNDPERLVLIDMEDGSVVDGVETESASTGNEHRSNGGVPTLNGNILGTSGNIWQPFSQAIWVSGYTGNHDPNPNLITFTGYPTENFDNSNATTVKHNNSSIHVGTHQDANGMLQAAALAGTINMENGYKAAATTTYGTYDFAGQNMRYHSMFGAEVDDYGGDYVADHYNEDMTRQMRHGKFSIAGVMVGTAGL